MSSFPSKTKKAKKEMSQCVSTDFKCSCCQTNDYLSVVMCCFECGNDVNKTLFIISDDHKSCFSLAEQTCPKCNSDKWHIVVHCTNPNCDWICNSFDGICSLNVLDVTCLKHGDSECGGAEIPYVRSSGLGVDNVFH